MTSINISVPHAFSAYQWARFKLCENESDGLEIAANYDLANDLFVHSKIETEADLRAKVAYLNDHADDIDYKPVADVIRQVHKFISI